MKSKIWLLISGVLVLIVAVGWFGWKFVLPKYIARSGYIKTEPARKKVEEKIYTVSELAQILKDTPEYFKDKEIKVKAWALDKVPGLGCSDYSIAGDIQESDFDDPSFWQGTWLNRPTINTRGVGEYGLYSGHFYDKGWMAACKDPQMFVVTGYQKIELDLPSVSQKEIVSYGYIIIEGRLLRRPYEIKLENDQITVNSLVYKEETGNFPWRRFFLKKAYNNLLTSMKRGDLEIIFSQGYTRTQPNVGKWKPQDTVKQLDETINSNLPRDQKKEKIKQILDNQYLKDKYLEDMLNNWNKT